MFSSIVFRFEMDYWVLHCGNDGYLYLLLQRRFLKLTYWLSLIMLVGSAIMNIYDPSESDDSSSDPLLSQQASDQVTAKKGGVMT